MRPEGTRINLRGRPAGGEGESCAGVAAHRIFAGRVGGQVGVEPGAVSGNIPVLTVCSPSSRRGILRGRLWGVAGARRRAALDEDAIETPFRACVDAASWFPVFINRPFFKSLELFMLIDVGGHVLDAACYLFGEARSVYCQARRVVYDIGRERTLPR